MVSALENIREKPTLPDYNEKANTLEKLAILKAWAQVFTTAVENGLQNEESLSEILKYVTSLCASSFCCKFIDFISELE
jgi:hypothetical protein